MVLRHALFWSVSTSAQEATECIVPKEQVIGTSVGPDGIPSLTSPEVVEAAAGDEFMFAGDLVLGIVLNGEARAHPDISFWFAWAGFNRDTEIYSNIQ